MSSGFVYFVVDLSNKINYRYLGLFLIVSACLCLFVTFIFNENHYETKGYNVKALFNIVSFIVCFFATVNYFYGNKNFKSISELLLNYILINMSITGLYRLFLLLHYKRNRLIFSKIGLCVSYDNAIAYVEEFTIADENRLYKEKSVQSIPTEKMYSRKNRVDDFINITAFYKILDEVKSCKTSAIDKAILNVCDITARDCKNTVIDADSRRKLSECFLTVIRLHAKYVR